MSNKIFKLSSDQINQLIQPMGGCIASHKITVEGQEVGYMYRVEPEFKHDSGWRFFSGTEDQNYIDDANNLMIYDVNTIANYDEAIISYLSLPAGTELERIKNEQTFKLI